MEITVDNIVVVVNSQNAIVVELSTDDTTESVGTGGSMPKWEEAAEAPVRQVENGIGAYIFPDGVDQYLYTAIRVPTSYTPGQQIAIKAMIYDSSESGTVQMDTLTTLIRPTDPITDTTNQHASTNSSLNLGSGTADEPNAVSFDLCTVDGEINTVAIAPGDLLLVRLTRDHASDTSTGDIRFVEQSTEVTFS